MGNQGSSGFFEPKPLGYAFKTEERIDKWFKKRGVENVGHIWIYPEPKEHLNIKDCDTILQAYAQDIKKCTLYGHICDGKVRTRLLHHIYVACGIKITPPPPEDSRK